MTPGVTQNDPSDAHPGVIEALFRLSGAEPAGNAAPSAGTRPATPPRPPAARTGPTGSGAFAALGRRVLATDDGAPEPALTSIDDDTVMDALAAAPGVVAAVVVDRITGAVLGSRSADRGLSPAALAAAAAWLHRAVDVGVTMMGGAELFGPGEMMTHTSRHGVVMICPVHDDVLAAVVVDRDEPNATPAPLAAHVGALLGDLRAVYGHRSSPAGPAAGADTGA